MPQVSQPLKFSFLRWVCSRNRALRFATDAALTFFAQGSQYFGLPPRSVISVLQSSMAHINVPRAQRALSDAAAREDSDALPLSAGQHPVEGAYSEGERFGDAAHGTMQQLRVSGERAVKRLSGEDAGQ